MGLWPFPDIVSIIIIYILHDNDNVYNNVKIYNNNNVDYVAIIANASVMTAMTAGCMLTDCLHNVIGADHI